MKMSHLMTLLRKNPLICAVYRRWGVFFTGFNWMLIRTLCCDVLKTAKKIFIVRILSSEKELLVYYVFLQLIDLRFCYRLCQLL